MDATPSSGSSLKLAGLWKPALIPGGVFLLHVVLSLGFGIYERWPRWDVPMHVAGGVAIAYFLARALRVVFGEIEAGPSAVMVFCAATTTAVLWEFAEFLTDRYLGTKAQGGLPDTLKDLLLGMAGAAAWIGFARGTGYGSDRDPGDARTP